MAVARNEEELQEFRADDLAKKIKLEVPFERGMNTFLRKINSDFAQQYIAEGTVLDANDYRSELIALLALNYKRISKAFKFNIRESFDDKTSTQVDALINTNLNRFMMQASSGRSDLITDTTNKDIRQQLTAAVTELVEAEKDVNNLSVATLTRKRLNERTPGRSNIIAIAETELMSEGTKDIEQNTLIQEGVVLGGVVLATALKTIWMTTLDERTRVSHAQAHLQEKNPFGFFLVQGESLKYPGDPSGSPSNTIGCRCAAISSVF